MATIVAKVGIGMMVRIRLPISPDSGLLKAWIKQAEDKVTAVVSTAIRGMLTVMPGVSIEVDNAISKIDVKEIIP